MPLFCLGQFTLNEVKGIYHQMDKKNQKTIEGIINQFFKLLDLDVGVRILEKDPETVEVNIETDNSGLLIGYHGETLSSLQLILSLMIYKKLGAWTHVSLNVGNYREYREEQIKNLLDRVLEEVKATGEARALPYLPGNERRIVHLMLQDNPDVTSESQGEGQNRRVVIRPKVSAVEEIKKETTLEK